MSRPPHTDPGEAERIPLLDLVAGDRVRLPVMAGDEVVSWSEPVTIVRVLLIDSALAEVRWEPAAGDDPWPAHALLEGPAYHAGARRVV